jgi:hypothetical protein
MISRLHVHVEKQRKYKQPIEKWERSGEGVKLCLQYSGYDINAIDIQCMSMYMAMIMEEETCLGTISTQ